MWILKVKTDGVDAKFSGIRAIGSPVSFPTVFTLH